MRLLVTLQFAYMQDKKWIPTFLSVLLELSRKVCVSCNEVDDSDFNIGKQTYWYKTYHGQVSVGVPWFLKELLI